MALLTKFFSSAIRADANNCFTVHTREEPSSLKRTSRLLPWRLPIYSPDTEAFISLGERMLRNARQRNQTLGLLVMQATDLPELEILFGHEAANAAVHAVMKALSGLAGNEGLAIRTLPDTFTVLALRSTGEELEMALRRRLGKACSVELDFNEHEIVLVPDVQASTVADGDSLATTYSALCRAIESHRYMEHLRQDYLRREREARTRHVALSSEMAEAPAVEPSVAWSARLPPTMAMPLARY